jgi:HAD domain in Swiss Army Knife RNA repair proteins
MKIIFLDIDGVLNCDDTPNPRKFPYIVDSRLLELFREFVKATGAIVVLSSTWRVDPVGLFATKFYNVPFEDICPCRALRGAMSYKLGSENIQKGCDMSSWTMMTIVLMNSRCSSLVLRQD